jgi:eukaryotic-like serine/threonine-protein kinase
VLAVPSAVEASWGLKRGDEIDPSLVVISEREAGTRYEVFHAWDRELFCEVAVKVLRPNRLGERHAVAAFEREASVARRLEHPNLVRFLREHLATPRPYLVLEYVRAQTLDDHLKAHDDVSVPEICLLGIRMCSALAYMHGRSIVHLDIKPANLTMGDPPRLLDLSIARFAPGAVPLGGEVGTPAYMAPEQCRVEPVTTAADIWGLGATLYEGLTGMEPFTQGREDSDVPAERYPQLVEDPEPLRVQYPQLPPTLDRVILACLQKDPAKRPTARQVAVALEGVLEDFRMDELLAWPRGLPVERERQGPVAKF